MIGQQQQGANRQSQQNYQAHIERNNAIIAQNNQITAQRAAADAIARGEQEVDVFSAKVRRAEGSQRAALAANGVLVDSGSALDLVEETGELGRLDALNIRATAAREALNFESQATNFAAQSLQSEAQSRLHVMAGEQARQEANMKSFGSLLGTGGTVASKWSSVF
jgi:hypothetical protein